MIEGSAGGHTGRELAYSRLFDVPEQYSVSEWEATERAPFTAVLRVHSGHPDALLSVM